MRFAALAVAGFFAAAPLRAQVAPATPLDENVPAGLDMIANGDRQDLGAEAAKVRQWMKGREKFFLAGAAPNFVLEDGKGAELPLSEGMGWALSHLNSYFGLTAQTVARPISFEELRAAVLSPQGVADIRGLFEQMLAQPVEEGGVLVFPEIGGEATLSDGRVVFHQSTDEGRGILRRFLAAKNDRPKMIALYQANRALMARVDDQQILWKSLMAYPEWIKKGYRSKDAIDKVLADTVVEVVGTAGNSFVWTPENQFDSLMSDAWSGRYVGRWHSHPPLMTRRGWRPPMEGPSEADLDVARRNGQNLTVAFHPEGFDVYDLSPLYGADSADISKVRVITYRSPEWKDHFQALWSRLR